MCPAVGDWLSFCVVALADEGSLFRLGGWRSGSFGAGGLKLVNGLRDHVGDVCLGYNIC